MLHRYTNEIIFGVGPSQIDYFRIVYCRVLHEGRKGNDDSSFLIFSFLLPCTYFEYTEVLLLIVCPDIPTFFFYCFMNITRFVIVIFRDQAGRMNFLRVEIVLQEATYFVIFTNAETMPPPLRIDNFSQVNLHFHQVRLI